MCSHVRRAFLPHLLRTCLNPLHEVVKQFHIWIAPRVFLYEPDLPECSCTNRIYLWVLLLKAQQRSDTWRPHPASGPSTSITACTDCTLRKLTVPANPTSFERITELNFGPMQERFSIRGREVVRFAEKESRRLTHAYVGPEHILLGIIGQGAGAAGNLLRELSLNLGSVRDSVQAINLDTNEVPSVESPVPTDSTKEVIAFAAIEAADLEHASIGPEHLLLGLIRHKKNLGFQVLLSHGVDPEILRGELVRISSGGDMRRNSDTQEIPKPSSRSKIKSDRGPKTPMLDRLGCDLTELARAGDLDPVIGQENTISRLSVILCRRRKSNPLMLGPPGVGKTAIIEGLAQRVVHRAVPMALQSCRLVSLSLSALVSGTKYRGEFEKRTQCILNEMTAVRNVILFIDEFHNIIGSGSTEGAPMDLSEILKPLLARSTFRCIGATTNEEYYQHIEQHGALARRFQNVYVTPPGTAETLRILRGVRHLYEAHHDVQIGDAALEAAVSLSDQYLPGRFQPDKALDLIDEASALVQHEALSSSGDLHGINSSLISVIEAKDKAVSDRDFSMAATLRDEERRLRIQKTLHTTEGDVACVLPEHILHVAEQMRTASSAEISPKSQIDGM